MAAGTEAWRWVCLTLLVSVPVSVDYLTAPKPKTQAPPKLVTGYVLMQQTGNQPARFVPDPRSPRFPQDATAFTGAQASWSCSWNVAVRTMIEERQGGRTRYSCRQERIRLLENVK